MEIQHAKIAQNSTSGHHRTSCRVLSSQLRHVSTIGKKLVKHQYLPHRSSQYGELWPTVGEFWDTAANFNGFRGLAALLHGTSSGREPNFAALNRGRHLYSAGRPSRWALAHILVNYDLHLFSNLMTVFCVTQGRVVMGTQAVSPYQQVIEKTKNLAFRSQMLVMNIEKKLATKDQEVVGSVEHFGFLVCCS